MSDRATEFEGCLLGTAVGDALGLPWEGLSRDRIARQVGDQPLTYRFLYGRGMVSDDTEHTLLVGQALLRSGGDALRFQSALAWGLRGWLLGAPAGIGLATLRACLRLSFGIPRSRSGVMSAGNGPAMRAALIGVYFADDLDRLIEFCDRSSVITHRDPRAVVGARLVAIAARCACLGLGADTFFEDARRACEFSSYVVDDWVAMQGVMRDSLAERDARQTGCRRDASAPSASAPIDVNDFAGKIGVTDRVSGYVLQSVPVALFAWLVFRSDLRGALEAVIRMGGDTDTVGAIVGALCGAEAGAIPEELVRGLWEWPRGVTWMHLLAARLASKGEPLGFAWPLVWPRNALFAGVVLYHGFKRLF